MSTQDNTYNGYKSYENWNQALWLQNDERLYDLVEMVLNRSYDNGYAAVMLYNNFNGGSTPDGVKWTISGIAEALENF